MEVNVSPRICLLLRLATVVVRRDLL